MADGRIVRVAEVAGATLYEIDGLATVREAINLMKRHGVSSLVIGRRHEGDEYGVVTVKDIAEQVVAAKRSVERTSVYEIMTKPTLTISPDMNVKYAIRLLARLGLSRALVPGEDGAPRMVTLRDLVLSYVETSEPEGGAGTP